MFFVLGACGEKSQPPEKKQVKTAAKKTTTKKVKKAKKIIEEEEKAAEEAVKYRYDPLGKKDPFKPAIQEEKKLKQVIVAKGPLTPLQKYSLTDLRVVAIISGTDDPKAMVEDSKGDGYILSKGTLIGDQYGEVSEIKENEVIVVEKIIDPDSGEIVNRNVSLILYKPEEEGL